MFTGHGRSRKHRYGAKVKPLSPWQTWSGWKRGERPWASNYSGYAKPIHGGAALARWLLHGVTEGKEWRGEVSPWAVDSREFFRGWVQKSRFMYRDGSVFVILRVFGLSYARQVHQPGRQVDNLRKRGVWWDDSDLAPTSRGGGGPSPNGARKGR